MLSWLKKGDEDCQLDDPKMQQTEEEKNTGLFDHLKNKEIITFKLFKIWVEEKNLNDQICDDWFLYRFCVARNFKLEKVQAMFQTNYQKRTFYNVQNCLDPSYEVVRENMPNVLDDKFVGFDKIGRPIKVTRYFKLCAKSIKACDMYQWWQWNFRCVEEMVNVVFPYCSKRAGKRIDQFVLIHDMGDCDMTPLIKDSELRKYCESASQIGQECYPELMGQLWFVNAPAMFTTLWAFAKMFLSAKTLQKTKIFGKKHNFNEELCKELGKENLPDFLGGDIPNFETHEMPWTKFLNHCVEKKTFYPNNENICSDPLVKAQEFDFNRC